MCVSLVDVGGSRHTTGTSHHTGTRHPTGTSSAISVHTHFCESSTSWASSSASASRTCTSKLRVVTWRLKCVCVCACVCVWDLFSKRPNVYKLILVTIWISCRGFIVTYVDKTYNVLLAKSVIIGLTAENLK
jgi:hypothetical protein